MISQEAIQDYFPDVRNIGNGVLRFTLEVPARKDTYYLKCYSKIRKDVLVVVEGDGDDAFVKAIFRNVFDNTSDINSPTKVPLGFSNPYDFEAGFVVGADYHGYLKGTLDDLRGHLHLCVPSYQCEFSGDETVDEFLYTWVYIMSHALKRGKCPKMKMCLLNPKTRAHTQGRFVVRSARTLGTTIEALEGVLGGELRLINYLKEELLLTSPEANRFVIEIAGKKRFRDKPNTLATVEHFLTIGDSEVLRQE